MFNFTTKLGQKTLSCKYQLKYKMYQSLYVTRNYSQQLNPTPNPTPNPNIKFIQEQTDQAIEKTKHFYKIIMAYPKGVATGVGMFTGCGLLLHFYWPTIQNKSSNTAEKVLQTEEVINSAKELANSITSDTIQDKKIQQLVCAMLINIIKDNETKKEFINLLKITVNDPEFQEETEKCVIDILNRKSIVEATKKLAIDLINDPDIKNDLTKLLLSASHDVLVDQQTHQKGSHAIWKSVLGLFNPWNYFS